MRTATLLAFAAAAALGTANAGPAMASEPHPFGLYCQVNDGVRFCEGGAGIGGRDKRVKSWDGVPLDVDVTLPSTGDGPWPLISCDHGWAGNKLECEGGGDLGSDTLAQRGYAVMTHTARGFGASCGSLLGSLYSGDLFGTLGCPDDAWVHLADTRYEARDIQYLAGLLVDEGIAEPGIGVTGESYGGGRALILAKLKDRIMEVSEDGQSGTLKPWMSPGGTPMHVAAAYAIAPWSDLAYALTPNGRMLDVDSPTSPEQAPLSTWPIGVKKESWMNTLYLGYLAMSKLPAEDDPRAQNANLPAWFARIDAGEPYNDDDSRNVANQVYDFHSAISIDGSPAPTLMASGWTDDLFPPIHSVSFYNSARAADPNAPVALDIADIGHSRAQNKRADRSAINADGLAWLDHYLKGDLNAPAPAPGEVRTWTQTCPSDEPSSGPFVASEWRTLAAGSIEYRSDQAQSIDAAGGIDAIAEAIDPNPIIDQLGLPAGQLTPNACRQTSAIRQEGVATYELPPMSTASTMLGLPTIEADIATSNSSQVPGEIAGRLWDVDPASNTQTLVSKGVFRLTENQTGTIRFQLNGNGWQFTVGHVPKIELLGRDSESYRPSNNVDFKIDVRSMALSIPLREAVVTTAATPAPEAGATPEPAATDSETLPLSADQETPRTAEEVTLAVTRPRLRSTSTNRLTKRRLARYLSRGLRGVVTSSTRIEKIEAAIARKKGDRCFSFRKPARKMRCDKLSSRGLSLRRNGDNRADFTFRPVRSLSNALRMLRRGTYKLVFRTRIAGDKDATFKYRINLR